MGTDLKGDFIGFWLDDIHSSELGIIRTSNGSRFDQNLLPTIQDKTVQVPGADGFYYFGSYYTQRQFNIPIAFDNMEEADFRKLNRLIGSKKMMKLVFDETPYKYYNVKSTGSPNLKYVCFDDDVKKRIYKGEGTLNFVAYDPFGYARADTISKLKMPDDSAVANEEEWSFDIPYGIDSKYKYPLPANSVNFSWEDSSGSIKKLSATINSGDYDCDYQIFCLLPAQGGIVTISDLQFNQNTEFNESFDANVILQLNIPETVAKTERHFCFDSRTNCVYGYDLEEGTGKRIIDYNTIYNKYLIASNFGKLPIGSSILWISGLDMVPVVKPFFKYF